MCMIPLLTSGPLLFPIPILTRPVGFLCLIHILQATSSLPGRLLLSPAPGLQHGHSLSSAPNMR